MTKKKTTIKLLGCPWCGNEPVAFPGLMRGWVLSCFKCDASTHGQTKQRVAKSWNRRAKRKTYEVEG